MRIEGNHFVPQLRQDNPTFVYLKRAALHAKDMPGNLRWAILDPDGKNVLMEYLQSSIDTKALIQTTTAVDVVRGGDKCL